MVDRPIAGKCSILRSPFHRAIIKNFGPVDHVEIHSRTIDRQRLDGRPRLPHPIRGQVQNAVAFFFTTTARNTDQLTIGLHNDHGSIGLFFYIAEGFQIIALDSGKNRIFRVLIGKDYIQIILDIFIHRCIDAVAAFQNFVFRRLVGISIFIHQILNDLFQDIVLKIAQRSLLSRIGGIIISHYLDLFCHGLVVLCLGNISLLEHLTQNPFPAFPVIFLVIEQLPLGRVLGNGDQRSTFRNTQLADILTKIQVCRGLYTIGIPS